MKSVGEVMAIGRNFQESVQKALRGLETGLTGFDEIEFLVGASHDEIEAELSRATPDRLRVAAQALREGMSVERIHAVAKFEPWFLRQIEELIQIEAQVRADGLPTGPEQPAPPEIHGLFRCAAGNADRQDRSRCRRRAPRA